MLSNNILCENEICHSTFWRHLLEEVVMGGKLRLRERWVSWEWAFEEEEEDWDGNSLVSHFLPQYSEINDLSRFLLQSSKILELHSRITKKRKEERSVRLKTDSGSDMFKGSKVNCSWTENGNYLILLKCSSSYDRH